MSLGGKWDPDLDSVMAGGAPLVRDWEFGPAGDTSGNVKYSGDGFITGYTVSNPFADVVTWSASMQITGSITRGTF